MDHIYIARWTDSPQEITPPSERERTKPQLRQGCEPCHHLAELVARIQEERVAEVVVPEHLVRAAIAVFRPGGGLTPPAPASAPAVRQQQQEDQDV
jgi:hypothetical protein